MINNRSLSQLEKDDWGDPTDSAPPTLRRCFELRKIPLSDMGVEDLRLLIGQDIGLQYLIPIAVKILEKDPLAKGQHYFGDLLVNVLRADGDYYNTNSAMKKKVRDVIKQIPHAANKLDRYDYECTMEAIATALAAWRETGTD